ncbi:hypothetical protein [Plebeiibacterium sediminum]|uniref:Uncharacterized protein n=1 Tax=Plebeiibacterium sediminum TaxID=2992112 RepID=A0AAE3M4R6_9BACT|nr:hypothetical protein [Plebeiobacterium sediminum]MCW3787226.1 hypothetical protein [Plebeiobacterium sediminum]
MSHPILVWTGIVISIISCIIIYSAIDNAKLAVPPVKVVAISNKSSDLLNYSIPYMVSFFALDLNSINSLLSFAFFMLVLFLLTLKTHNIFVNPILALLGYSLLHVVYEKDGETNQKSCLVKGTRPKKNDICRIVDLSDNISVISELNPLV